MASRRATTLLLPLLLLLPAVGSDSADEAGLAKPLLFMLPGDTRDPWGLMFPVATPMANLSGQCGLNTWRAPPEIVAAFDREDGAIDVVQKAYGTLFSSVTRDFLEFDNRTFFLPPSGLPRGCTVEDMAKRPGADDFLLALFCEGNSHGHNGAVLLSGDIRRNASFRLDPQNRFNFTNPNFIDHDDIHLIWQEPQWLDYQISFQQYTTRGFEPRPQQCNDIEQRYACKNGMCVAAPTGSFPDKAACEPQCTKPPEPPEPPCNETIQTKKYCDNVGCGMRRVVTTRTSSDGFVWSSDSSCPGRVERHLGDEATCPQGYNLSGMILPDPELDPPELEFYTIKPFRITGTNRLAAHAVLYAPSPQDQLGSTYGVLPSQHCVKPSEFNLTHCHGPHMHTERLISDSVDAANLSAWQRPFRRQTALERRNQANVPLEQCCDIGPVSIRGHHTWVVQTAAPRKIPPRFELWGVPMLRLAGIYAPANAEFTTPSFAIGEGTESGLWLNAAARWASDRGPGESCDEGCQAYVMVEMRDAAGLAVVGGRSRDKCVMLDVDGPKLRLKWEGVGEPVALGTRVALRIFFRDATVYAVGSGE